jgi:hypothetical protein
LKQTHIQKSDFVFIGEDHFTNEIPLFTSAIATKVEFDNFFIETDPYSAKIIESKIKTLGDLNFKKYQDDLLVIEDEIKKVLNKIN